VIFQKQQQYVTGDGCTGMVVYKTYTYVTSGSNKMYVHTFYV